MRWLLAVLAAALLATAHAGGSCDLPTLNRVDCGWIGITQDQCLERGCCWSPSATLGIPWCYYTTVDGYAVDSGNCFCEQCTNCA